MNPKFLGQRDVWLSLGCLSHIRSNPNERHAITSREPKVFFAPNARDEEHPPLCVLQGLRRGLQVFLVGRSRNALSRLRGIQSQAMPNFDPSKADAFQSARR